MHLYKVVKKTPKTISEKYVVADDYFVVAEKYPKHDGIKLIQKDIETITRPTDQ